MSRLEFLHYHFCSRATMMEHFQNNWECNIQHKAIGSDTIFIYGEDHFNRSNSEHQKNSGQCSLKTQSVFLSLQSLTNHRLYKQTELLQSLGHLGSLLGALMSYLPSSHPPPHRSIFIPWTFASITFIHSTLYLEQSVTDTLTFLLFLKQLDLAWGSFVGCPLLEVSSYKACMANFHSGLRTNVTFSESLCLTNHSKVAHFPHAPLHYLFFSFSTTNWNDLCLFG